MPIHLTNSSIDHYLVNTRGGIPIHVYEYGELDYREAQLAMQQIAISDEPDQIWLLQHPQTYTQGTACQQQTLLPSKIPVVKSDRGGQITYHGPGQIVMYPILRLRNHRLGVKALVRALEQAVIELLANCSIDAERQTGAPGIYVENKKIAALGLRIRRGVCYHGLSLNVDMDLSPFNNINPCGFAGLEVTQMADLADVSRIKLAEVGRGLVHRFCEQV